LIVEESTKKVAQSLENPTKFEKLDKELDLRQAVQELTRRAQDPNEDHDAIRIELEVLTAKAIAEGVNVGDDTVETSPSGRVSSYYPRRPYRGRGRGRGRGRFGVRGTFHGGGRGRGLTLDNRPKRLIVRGVPVGDEQQLEQIREWHQATGQADTMTFEGNGEIIVQFRTRSAAEQALTTSSHLKAQIQDLKVSWPPISQEYTKKSDFVAEHSDALSQEITAGETIDELGWGQGGDE